MSLIFSYIIRKSDEIFNTLGFKFIKNFLSVYGLLITETLGNSVNDKFYRVLLFH